MIHSLPNLLQEHYGLLAESPPRKRPERFGDSWHLRHFIVAPLGTLDSRGSTARDGRCDSLLPNASTERYRRKVMRPRGLTAVSKITYGTG